MLSKWVINGQKRIYAVSQAVNYILNLFENTWLQGLLLALELFEKLFLQMAVQSSEDLKIMALQYGDTFSEQRTRSTLLTGLPLNVR